MDNEIDESVNITETDEELLARSKDYCVMCGISFINETPEKTINRVRSIGNYCSQCNVKCNHDSKFNIK